MKRAISLILVLAMVLAMPVLAMADDSFSVGSVQDNSYWNEYLSIGCTLSDEWYFYTDEEIMENFQTTVGMMKEELAEAMKESGTLMDMLAVNTESGESINVNMERVSLTNALTISEKTYAETSVQQVKEAMEQMGWESVTVEADEMEFLGETHSCLYISCSLDGIDMYETQVIVKHGRTIVAITACSYWEDTTLDILANFYAEKP